MAIILDGKEVARKIRQNLKEEVNKLKEEGMSPKLVVIMVGNDPASKIYVKNKSIACNEIGIEYEEYLLDEETTMEELLDLIDKLNKSIQDGSYYQLPMEELKIQLMKKYVQI